MFNEIKVIAFDCDGVLFDSAAANVAYYNRILDHFQLPLMTAAQRAYVHMHTVHESLAYLFGDGPKALAAEAYRLRMEPAHFIRLMTPEPHLYDLLDWLHRRYQTAVATNRVDTMDRVIAEHHLEHRFDLIVTAADVALAKPHPDMLLAVLDHFGIGARQMIYIGDSAVDQQAAEQAGVPFIAYANAELPAAAHIDHLGQVVDLFEAHHD